MKRRGYRFDAARWLLVLLGFVLGQLLAIGPARADARTSFFAEQLRTNDDYRVRTQAALALGASRDKAAVDPLCDGLKDSNVSVRVASAAALGKLGRKEGLGCLNGAKAREKAPAAKAQLAKSIQKLEGGGGGGAAPPAPRSGDKFYVAIEVKNKTNRPSAEIEDLVRSEMQKQLLGSKGYAVAPAGETPAAGGQVVKANRLDGYYLLATVEAPSYAGGNLTQQIRVSMWTYPAKALKGEFGPKLTQSGTPSTDKASEDLLMKMCVENAIGNFKKVVASL